MSRLSAVSCGWTGPPTGAVRRLEKWRTVFPERPRPWPEAFRPCRSRRARSEIASVSHAWRDVWTQFRFERDGRARPRPSSRTMPPSLPRCHCRCRWSPGFAGSGEIRRFWGQFWGHPVDLGELLGDLAKTLDHDPGSARRCAQASQGGRSGRRHRRFVHRGHRSPISQAGTGMATEPQPERAAGKPPGGPRVSRRAWNRTDREAPRS